MDACKDWDHFSGNVTCDSYSNDSDSFGTDSDTNTTSVKKFITCINVFNPPPKYATIEEKLAFLKYHPVQPTYIDVNNLPFKPKIYFRLLPNGESVCRHCLSYSIELRKVFCSVCMVFSNIKTNFNSDGLGDFRHITQRINEHENSVSHVAAVNATLERKIKQTLNIVFLMNCKIRK